MIIDCHTHISDTKGKKRFSQAKDELLLNMGKNKVDYSIVISDNTPNHQCADLETVMALTKNESRIYVIGALKINDINKKGLARINELFRKKQIRGFKIFPGHDPVYPTDKRWHPVYKLCVKYGFPLIIHTGMNANNKKSTKYNDPKYIIKIAKIYPGLKIIIAHYFWPRLDYCFSMTEGFNNVFFDTSALADPKIVKASGGIKKIRDILHKTIRRRADSLIFGTDWPMCDVKKHIDLINSLQISKEKKDKILFRNALSLFKLEQI